jgi:hypothetical protein
MNHYTGGCIDFRIITALQQADPRCSVLTLPTDPGPPAGSVYISYYPRPSSALLDPPPRGPPVPSHSLPLFGGSPPRCVFDPCRREVGNEKRENEGEGEDGVSGGRGVVNRVE